ncbi:MAG: exodeoxyribonuclease III [Chlorobi bacterium]|nr:exodeoxyribonuclease III [Chlorobiota bacterium]
MKVCGFNVNSVRARLPLLEAWLEHRGNDLDILCMQELKAEEDQFPFDFFKRFGFTCYINAQKRYNGVGTCTKPLPEEVLTQFGHPLLDAEKRLLYTRYPFFHLINLYAPHGDVRGTEKFEFKLRWYDALREWIAARFDLERDKVVLVGDFNITFDDADVFDPVLLADTIGTMPEEREKLKALLDLGFVDAWRRLRPGEVQYTWWDYKGARIWKNEGMRIDFVLVSRALLPHLEAVEVDMWARRKNKIKPSDHAPVIATFRFDD